GKGLVKLYGEGDPTGRGEGFSFIRQSMKEMFYREGEIPPERPDPSKPLRFSYSEQQVVYKAEIRRIWNAQLRALRSPVPPSLTLEEEESMSRKQQLERAEEDERRIGFGGAYTPMAAASPPRVFSRRSDLDDDVMSTVDSQLSNAQGKTNKYLVINRLVSEPENPLALRHRSPEGGYHWTSEVVSNTKVINSYLRQRRIIENQLNE
ncbi:hypothetical protein HK405_000958, partial [Cladochytrium tenue]